MIDFIREMLKSEVFCNLCQFFFKNKFLNIKCSSSVSDFGYHRKIIISNSVKGETQENNTMKKQCIRIDFRILINSISSIIAKDIT